MNNIKFLFLLVFTSVSIHSQELLREPYLQSNFTDSITITWKTTPKVDKSSVKISWQEKKGFLFWKREVTKSRIVDGYQYAHDSAVFNEVVIKDLTPSTRYSYEIYSNDKRLAGGEDYYFKKSSGKEDEEFTFYALGDIGAKQPYSTANLPADQITKLTETPDFGLGLGDIVYPTGASNNYDTNLFAPFQHVFKSIPFYPVPGNHDWLSDPVENFIKEWNLPNNEYYYSFSYSNAYFIELDSRDGNFYNFEEQTKWLKSELKKAKANYDWVIVFLHHNGKTCTYKRDYDHVIKLYPIFAENKVDLVLNGHAHTYERLRPYDKEGNVEVTRQNESAYKNLNNRFISITIGAGGKINKKWEANPQNPDNCKDSNIVAHAEHVFSFGLVKIQDKNLSFKAINSETGEIFDEFKISK